MRFLPSTLRLRTNLERFVRRRQGLKRGKDGQESPADPETIEDDSFVDKETAEVIEPEPEPVPSARDEFHQAYTKKLQAADEDVEEYSRTFDSISYPVSARVSSLSPTTKPSHRFLSARPCCYRQSSSFSSTAKPNRARQVCSCGWSNVIRLTPLLIHLPPSGFYGISAAVAVISLSLFAKQYLRHRSSQEHRHLLNTKKRGSSTGFTWLTEGGVPLVALAVLSPFLLSQILSKTGQSFTATLSVVVVALLVLGFFLAWGPALLLTLITKTFYPRVPSRAPRYLPPTPSPLQKEEVSSSSSAPGGGETHDSTAPLTVTPILNPVGVDYQGNLTDARRLAWMLERSSDTGVISTILQFILEVLWTPDHLQDPDSSNAALIRSYELLWVAFYDEYATQPTLLRGMRGQAFAAAKAFIHIFIQGDYASDDPVISTLQDRHIPLGSSSSLKGDADLRSAAGIVDNFLGIRTPIQWSELQLTSSHRLWLSHILLYRAWYATKRGLQIPEDVMGFVEHSLSSDPRPRLAVVADCVLVVGLVVGHPLHEADLLVLEKTRVPPLFTLGS